MTYSPPLVSKEDRVRIVKRHGVEAHHAHMFYKKWIHLRFSSKSRGAECLLSFNEYMRLARRAGIDDPDMIGKSAGKYQMGRKKDEGNYVIGNCRFITREQNQRELTKNGGRAVGAIKCSKALRGRRKDTDPAVASQARRVSKRYTLIAPSGKVHKGLGLINFIKKHGLTPSHYVAFLALCNGKRESYKGWKGKFDDYRKNLRMRR